MTKTPCPNPYCNEGHVYGVEMGDVNLGHGPCEECDGNGFITESKMKTIHKFAITGNGPIMMTEGAVILHVGLQPVPNEQGVVSYNPYSPNFKSEVMVWAEVDPSNDAVPRQIQPRATGERFDPDGACFIGTVQLTNGLVWHLYDHGEIK